MQGYWPDGLLTPPSEEAMVWDLEKTLEMGFNMVRKHIKIGELENVGMLISCQQRVTGGITGLTSWGSSCGKTSPASPTWPRSRKRTRRTLPGNTPSEKGEIYRDFKDEFFCSISGGWSRGEITQASFSGLSSMRLGASLTQSR